MKALRIRGGEVVHPQTSRTTREDVWICGGHISASECGEATVLDASGLYVAPGFIDLQVNGGVGHSFENASVAQIDKIAGFHASHGTTGMLPTVVTAPIEEMRASVERMRLANHPAILGAHIEGPFIAPARKGAHNRDHIAEPSVDVLNQLLGENGAFVRVMTLAPELPGANEVIAEIRRRGIVASMGHSDASYEQAMEAITRGVTLFTHVFNAMRMAHHRSPGVVGAALASDTMVELIADGIHVHPGAVRFLFKAKGADRVCLVTDAVSAAGLHDGEHQLGGLKVIAVNGTARLEDGTLAGSTLTMDQALRRYLSASGCSIADAVRAGSLNPAKVLRLDDRKGSLDPGKDADVTVFDDELNVHWTIINGEVVFARDRQA